jgi:hypothetical protein
VRPWILCILLLSASSAGAEDDASLRSPPRFHVGGFVDVEVHTSSDNAREGLDLAELDLFSTAQFSNAWSGLVETVAQRGWKRDPNDRHAFELNLERLYATYSTSDALRLEIGQTHTGIVRWNEREHRSRILQTPIDVPAIARRPEDDGAWPLRFVGIWISSQAGGPLGLTWEAGAGAGPGSARDKIPIFNQDRSPAGFLSMTLAPSSVPGFDFGMTAYAQHLPARPDPLRERDLTLSANYVNSGTEIRAEWARMSHHSTRQPTTYLTTGYYVLFSKRLTGSAERARPYIMVDHLAVARGEQYLQESTNESAWAAGVRYDLTPRFSIKGEYRSQRAPDGDREMLLGVQFGLSF